VVINLLLSGALKLFPMAILHELGVELCDQRQDDAHVLNAVVKVHKGLPLADRFVLGSGGTALLSLHVLDQVGQVVSVDLFPAGSLPGVELHVDEGDEIPHLLQGDELVAAHLQLLVGSASQIEETLQVVEVLSSLLKLASLIVER
jgi:hypothetical protein